MQFPLYEHLKRVAGERQSPFLRGAPPCRVPLTSVPNKTGRDRTEPLTASQILGCSATAKMTASIVTYPHEVVRTRFQTEKRPLNGNGGHDTTAERRGLIRMTQHIVTHEGWRALYRGLSVNLVRTVPNSAVTMLTWVSSFRFLSLCSRERTGVLTVTCPRARFPCLQVRDARALTKPSIGLFMTR